MIMTIAGVDRTTDIQQRGFAIDRRLTYMEDDCKFTVTTGNRPAEGQELMVTGNGGKLFAGIIDSVKDMDLGAGITHYSCAARDYTYQLDREYVVEEYSDVTADAIVKDIVAKYCPGFTVNNVRLGAPSIEYQPFDDERPSACLKILADYVGWDWCVDYDRDIHFFNPAELAEPAPLKLEPGAPFRNFQRNVDINGLANYVRVRGGTYLSDVLSVKWVADGQARYWPLSFAPRSKNDGDISISVSEQLKTLGVEYLQAEVEPERDFMFSAQEKYVRCSTQTPTPVQGATIEWKARKEIPVITVVENVDSQAAIAAVQGGNGVYMHVVKDDSLQTLEAAEAAGDAYLRKHADPRVSGSFDTEVPGWAPGQLLEVDLPGTKNTFVVQSVAIRLLTPTEWTYRIEFGGRLMGIADYLQSVVSAQQKKRLSETTILQKYTYGQEKVEAIDELELTPREPPYYCGDPDAVCGFAECAGFFQIAACDWIGTKTGYEGK